MSKGIARLSEDQIPLWAAEYIKDFNATRTAIAMGYAPKSARHRANEVMSDERVQKAIKAAIEARVIRTQLQADDILRDLETIKNRCMEGEPIRDDEGNETGEWKFDSNGAIKALALYGKHIGMFADRSEVTGKDGKPVEMRIIIEDYKAE